MGAYARVFTRVWRDEGFRALPEEGRELFLYLLTSPHLNIVGFYYLSPAYAADDLQWPVAKVLEQLEGLSATGLIRFDPDAAVVLIPKYLRWNPFQNGNQAKGGAANLRSLPRTPLATEFRQAIERFAKPYEAVFADVWEAFGRPSEAVPEPLGNPSETLSNSVAVPVPVPVAATGAVADSGVVPSYDLLAASQGPPLSDLDTGEPEVVKVRRHLAKTQGLLREEQAKPEPDDLVLGTLRKHVVDDLEALSLLRQNMPKVLGFSKDSPTSPSAPASPESEDIPIPPLKSPVRGNAPTGANAGLSEDEYRTSLRAFLRTKEQQDVSGT